MLNIWVGIFHLNSNAYLENYFGQFTEQLCKGVCVCVTVTVGVLIVIRHGYLCPSDLSDPPGSSSFYNNSESKLTSGLAKNLMNICVRSGICLFSMGKPLLSLM